MLQLRNFLKLGETRPWEVSDVRHDDRGETLFASGGASIVDDESATSHLGRVMPQLRFVASLAEATPFELLCEARLRLLGGGAAGGEAYCERSGGDNASNAQGQGTGAHKVSFRYERINKRALIDEGRRCAWVHVLLYIAIMLRVTCVSGHLHNNMYIFNSQ